MKVLFSFLLLLTFASQLSYVNAQVEYPEDKAKWTFKVEQKGCEATIIAEVAIVPGWHINSVVLPKGTFGSPTKYQLIPSKEYKLVGSVTEPKAIVKFDEASGEDVSIHEGKIVLKQKILVLTDKDFTLKGKYGFQPCDESHCLFPYESPFSVKVKGCSEDDAAIAQNTDVDSANTANASQTPASGDDNNEDAANPKDDEGEKAVAGKDDISKKSLWEVFFLAFFSGFLALIMPCVFPMIPMTVSFFTKRSKTRAQGIRNSFLYGGSIILIHVLLAVIVIVTGLSSLLNELSTNLYFNLFFFAMLFVFGLSFLGAFEIQLPSKWVNKADEKADKGGVVGIFFMALVLSLASFSCTGPILGDLLVHISSSGGNMALLVGMFAFGLALALPFMLFALFPSWLNSMPSSGGWLNVVKVFLGFLEIAFAFKFLSTADTTMQWHLLEREVFISIWIAVFGTLALYMFGKLRLPHDSPVEKLSVGRTMIATLTLAFTLYLLPGLWGAPLKLVNAFLPPDFYAESPKGFGGGGGSGATAHLEEGMHEGPQGIPAFTDYDKALAYAQKVNKPLFVDFTGWGCVNCRKMEQSVWGEPGVIEHLRNDVVIVSLYVDERTELPKSEQKTIKLGDRDFSLVTVGNKWTAKQIGEYQTSSQPYYVLQTPDGKDIPVGSANYQNHSNPKVFQAWLEKGLKASKK
ncbi:MAG TPA: cytochrome c biogenesis protein CcdA [Fluviicola sp.]|nr:cytochrome c biogenesis protein CcdA [Fluviicola sp.]